MNLAREILRRKSLETAFKKELKARMAYEHAIRRRSLPLVNLEMKARSKQRIANRDTRKRDTDGYENYRQRIDEKLEEIILEDENKDSQEQVYVTNDRLLSRDPSDTA